MQAIRLSSCLVVVLVVCACVATTQAGDIKWRQNPAVQQYLQTHPLANRMSQGPVGTVIDFIIDIIIILLDLILGGDAMQFGQQVMSMRQEMRQMRTVMGMSD